MQLFVVRDIVTQDAPVMFHSLNIGTAKRLVKGALLSQEDNFIKQNYKDKQVFLIGEYDSILMKIVPQEAEMVFTVLQLEEELELEIAARKKKAEDLGVKTEDE